MKFAIYMLAALVGAATAETAFAYCSEPSAPYCASSYGAFDDQWEFDRCRSEMESYRDEVEEFVSCLQRKVDAAFDEAEDVKRSASNDADNATSEYSDAVDSFNRRAN